MCKSVCVCVCDYVLVLSVEGGHGGRFSAALGAQLLADVWRGVRAFEFGLLSLALRLSLVLLLLLFLRLGGRRRLGFSGAGLDLRRVDLRRVQVHAVGGGVVISVGARHRVQKLQRRALETPATTTRHDTRNTCCCSYLHPAVWQPRDGSAHLLTVCSRQRLPLAHTHTHTERDTHTHTHTHTLNTPAEACDVVYITQHKGCAIRVIYDNSVITDVNYHRT